MQIMLLEKCVQVPARGKVLIGDLGSPPEDEAF